LNVSLYSTILRALCRFRIAHTVNQFTHELHHFEELFAFLGIWLIHVIPTLFDIKDKSASMILIE